MLKYFEKLIRRKEKPPSPLRADLKARFKLKYAHFKELISSNDEILVIITNLEEKLTGRDVFGMAYLRSAATRAAFHAFRMAKNLNLISGDRYPSLYDSLEKINNNIRAELYQKKEIPITELVIPYTAVHKDMIDSVGGKNAPLGEIKNRVNLTIPDGFVITTYAYRYFLEQNDLQDEINKRKMQLNLKDPQSVEQISEEIQGLIITAPIPTKLEEAILNAYQELADRLGHEPQVSLRSSAIGEDSELSFAGQYLSALNVPREKIVQTYKYVIASLYTPRAIFYRLNKGIREEDTAMSVGCLEMVDSLVSGVAYSRHPYSPIEDSIIINAVWGLGPYAVDGTVQPDVYVISKDENLSILETRTPVKDIQLYSDPGGGIKEIPVPEERKTQPCLSPAEIRTLARAVLALERHFRSAQDIEWALDARRRLIILQSRPLRISAYEKSGLKDAYAKISGYPVLVEKGSIAYPGVGYGKAYHVYRDEDMLNFPEGAVLVTRHSSPKFVRLMNKAKAIVTDAGGTTGHMASLAREFKVPTILGAQMATEKIPAGMEITVDAYTGRVYQGKVGELTRLDHVHETYMKNTDIYKTLERLCRHITPLHLTDTESSTFAPQFCTSLHDIARYVHEKSFTEMFEIADVLSDEERVAVHLNILLPINLYMIDLGKGLNPEKTYEARRANMEDITSVPLKALLKGMTHKDIRWYEPRPVDLRGFLSVMGRQMVEAPESGRRLGDKSYAIISDKYLNFSSRIGYHFCTIDSYCGLTPSKNYISFRFKGGAADDIRRARRARAIGNILEGLGFTVDVKGDLINARIKKYEQEFIKEKLDMLGRLNLFTRQMDMLMASESRVDWVVQAFLEGNYNLDEDFQKKPGD
ncbi:MAG TPA: phosphoenolpyruvate synthase [Proteobacteria bacterium]|nr:phosphoenolpyruvate synthase [Pseudomonadota bacterium]